MNIRRKKKSTFLTIETCALLALLSIKRRFSKQTGQRLPPHDCDVTLHLHHPPCRSRDLDCVSGHQAIPPECDIIPETKIVVHVALQKTMERMGAAVMPPEFPVQSSQTIVQDLVSNIQGKRARLDSAAKEAN